MIQNNQIRIVAALLLAVLALPSPVRADASQPGRAGESAVVVELFTSQGCDACPPADALLGRIAAKDGIVALAFHVDYWDYLGWRDRFAQTQFTERQYGYRRSLRRSAVYTPQMIVQGSEGVVGSNAAEVKALIAEARSGRPKVGIKIRRVDGMLKGRLEPIAERAPCIIWTAIYDRRETVAIEGGENAGREITYHNVVRSLTRLGSWAGKHPEEVALPQPDPGEGVALWVQAGETGPILAGAKFER